MEAELERLRVILAGRKIPEAREALAALAASLENIDEQQRLVLAASGSTERRRAIDVSAEIASFHDIVRPLLDGQGVTIKVTTTAAEVLRTEMRPENFFCLLQILTSNAVEWARRVESPTIWISASATEEHCEVIFSDNGPGISLDICGRIFDPLFSRKEAGRGMGLTIARQLVEAHGGRISLLIDGRRRQGAAFQILFPRKRSRATIYNGA